MVETHRVRLVKPSVRRSAASAGRVGLKAVLHLTGIYMRLNKGAEGIARVFFCTLVGKRIVMLHSFVKKSDKTPPREREIAEHRLKEIKNANS